MKKMNYDSVVLLVLYHLFLRIILEIFMVQIVHKNKYSYNCTSMIQYIYGNKNLGIMLVRIHTYTQVSVN